MRKFCVIATLLIAGALQAQLTDNFFLSQYNLVPYIQNPSMAGIYGRGQGILYTRTDLPNPTGYNFGTYAIGAYNTGDDSSGQNLGIMGLYLKEFDSEVLGGDFTYAYQHTLESDVRVRVGGSIGYRRFTLYYDPLLNAQGLSGKESKGAATLNFGVSIMGGKAAAGISGFNLNRPRLDFAGNDRSFARIYLGFLKYDLYEDANFKVTTTALGRYMESGRRGTLDGDLQLLIAEKFGLHGGVRVGNINNTVLKAGLSAYVGDAIIAFSYDYPVASSAVAKVKFLEAIASFKF